MRFFAHRYAAATLILVASFAGASACTTDADSGQSQVPDGVAMMSDRPADTVILVPPKGWECNNVRDQAAIVYICIRPGDNEERLASLRIEHFSSRFLLAHDRPFDGERDFDVAHFFNVNYDEQKKSSQVTHLERLPERTIGGEKAYGLTYTPSYTFNGKRRTGRGTSWTLGRSDGLWNIRLYSANGSDTIPPELLQAVDTITWIPTPEPEPQSSQSD